MDTIPFWDFYDPLIGEDLLGDIIEPVLMWMSTNLKGDWKVCSHVHPIDAPDQPSNHDLMVRMWFSFDNSDDAVLARMTWPQLRHQRHAHT